MVRFDGTPLYPQRRCDTLSYDLSRGPGSEQDLYDATTDYIRSHYNRARALQKLIVFTEHRDTAHFLVRRLERLGFTGRIALIHGGLPYQERERQLESDKVFDVVGRLFEGLSFKDYLEQAVTEEDADAAVRRLEGRLTEDQLRPSRTRNASSSEKVAMFAASLPASTKR